MNHSNYTIIKNIVILIALFAAIIGLISINSYAEVKVQGTPDQQKELADWLSKSLGTTVTIDTTTGVMSIDTGGNASATRLRNMINDTSVSVTLQIVDNSPQVFLGGFQPGVGGVSTGTQLIDIDDLENMGNVNDSNGFTPDMVLMHEITEVFTSVRDSLTYEDAHENGITAEEEEMGAHGVTHAGERVIWKGDTIFLKIRRSDGTYIVVGSKGWGLNPEFMWYKEKVPCKFDSGLIAIADPGNNFPVLTYQSDFSHSVLINNLEMIPGNPTATAFDGNGNIYITEDLPYNDQIRVYNQAGTLINMYSGPELIDPKGIDIDKETGEIFVAARGHVLRYNADFMLMGEYFLMILNFRPTDVAVFRNKPRQCLYSDGTIYDIFVTDSATRQVYRFNTSLDMGTGSHHGAFGLPHLNDPEGIFVDSWWNVWVASTGNHRIYTFTIDGQLIPHNGHPYFIEDPIMNFNDMQMVDHHGLYAVGGSDYMIGLPGMIRYDYEGNPLNFYGLGFLNNPASLAIAFFPNTANLIAVPDPCPYRDSLIVSPAQDMVVMCDPLINMAQLNTWLESNGGAVADSTLDTVFWSNNYTGFTYTCGKTGYATVTFTATDICGNKSETTATFTIVDLMPPLIACPPDQIRTANPADLIYTVVGDEFDPLDCFDICCKVIPYNSLNGDSTLAGMALPLGLTTIDWMAMDSCGNVAHCLFNVTVNPPGAAIGGRTRYAGKANAGNPAPNPPTYNPAIYNIDNVIVILRSLYDGVELARDTSDVHGFYEFTSIPNGEYILSYDKYTADSMQAGNGIDAIDVTMLKYYIGVDTITDPSRNFSAKYKKAGDVDNNSAINAIDISRIKAKIGAPYNPLRNFPKGNWVALDTVIIVAATGLVVDLKTICYGDYNASSSKYRDSADNWSGVKSIPADIIFRSDEYITVNDAAYFEIPLRMSTKMNEFSAMGLELSYPTDKFKLVRVTMPNTTDKNGTVKINPSLEEIIADDNDLLVTDENGVIRVVFATTNHFDVAANDEIITLGFSPLKNHDAGEIEFELSGTGIIGNQYGQENDEAYLIMPRIFVRGNNSTDGFVFAGHPNPFNGEVTLSYAIPDNGTVRLSVYNAIGEMVSELVNALQSSGNHTLVFSGKDLPAGMYAFKLEFTGKDQSKSILLNLIH
ncbi:MAG TPA: HYR domain-containing protein [Bacteroidales bacterium]|nr:HYR domain-containing protein [Bacteroidales bacterium]